MSQPSWSHRESDDVSLDVYLREISTTKMLSADEEKELGQRVAQGDNAARDLMARANLRLVVNLARHYRGRGLSLSDLIAEGNLGLLRAVEGFDPALGTRFSTYASYWIKQSIRNALVYKAPTVRLPYHVVKLLNKWLWTVALLLEELGREPQEDEIAGRLGLTSRQRECVRQALSIHEGKAQNDQDEEAPWILESFPDHHDDHMDDALDHADRVKQILRLLALINDREAIVVRLHFGLDGENPHTLAEIGAVLGITRERVRQIECRALVKLGAELRAG